MEIEIGENLSNLLQSLAGFGFLSFVVYLLLRFVGKP